MSKAKRVLALSLAAMMILMVLGATVLQMGYAANPSSITIESVIVSPKTFIAEQQLKRIDVSIKDETPGIGKNAVTKQAQISVHSDSDFKQGQIQIAGVDNKTTTVNNANFSIVVFDCIASNNAQTLKFTVTDNTKNQNYNQTFEVDVPGFDDGIPDPDPDPEPPVATDSKTKYSVTKVRTSTTANGNNTPIPNENGIKYDIDKLDNRSDATIRQTYFADVILKVTDEKATPGISKVDILQGQTKMEMGSFVYDEASLSGLEVIASEDGYFEIKLTALRYSGNDKKLSFRVKTPGGYITNVSTEISECMTRKEAAAESDKNSSSNDDDDRPLEVETPYVIVSKYGYGGGDVTAGETFTLSMTFQNTSENSEVGNMMITLTMPDDLMLTSSSNTFYVPTLEEKSSITKSVQVTAKAAAKVQSHNITVAMKYQYVDSKVGSRKDATTTENIAIPVIQIDRFEVTGVDLPMEAMVEEEVSITVNYVNKGRSEVFNLSASIAGNVQNPGQNQNLGNLASGATGSADFFVKPSEMGTMTGEITITYEDTNMEQKSATIPYNMIISEMGEGGKGGGGMVIGGIGGMMPGEEVGGPVEPEKSSLPIYIAIGVVLVLIVVGVLVKKRLDKKRREREDADL